MRRALRKALLLVTLTSLAIAATQGWRLSQDPTVAWLTDRTTAQISAVVERQMARTVTPDWVDSRLTELLAAEPRNWDRIATVEALAAEHAIPIPDPDGLTAAYTQDHGLSARAATCAACAWDRGACAPGAGLACGLALDLTPVGDVQGLTRQAGNAVRGEPVDQLDVGLSALGLGATALAIPSGGSALMLKAGAGFLRTARRIGALSPALAGHLTRLAGAAFDWRRLSRTSPARLADDIVAAANPAALRPLTDTVTHIGTAARTAGLRPTLALLRHVDTPAEARQLRRAADALGPRTARAAETLGPARLFRATLRLSGSAIALVASLATLAGALAGLGLSAATTRTSQIARRALR